MKFLKRLRPRFPRRAGGSRRPPQPQASTSGRPTQINQPLARQNDHFGLFKTLGYFIAVVMPAAAVIYCNYLVFPESYEIATIIVLISVGIAGLFTIGSNWATPAIARKIVNAHFLLMIALSVNLGAHWILSREKSGAVQATAARHLEEDRQAAFKRQEAEQQIRLMNAQRDLTTAEGRAFANEAWRNNTARRLGMSAPGGTVRSSGPRNSILPSPAPSGSDGARPTEGGTNKLTVADVMEKWNPILIWLALLDLGTSIVAYGWIARKWEWDRNRDGIPDHLQVSGNVSPSLPHSVSQPTKLHQHAGATNAAPGNGKYHRP